VERISIAFTTLTIFAPLAQAGHLQPAQQAIKPEGTARPLEFVATEATAQSRGYAFARQVLAAQTNRPSESVTAQSRVIYLNRDGAILRPGDNDATRQVSSIVNEPTEIAGWGVDDATWSDTVSCIAGIYARFDVTVTDQDPGDTPHIEAMFGGSPGDLGLPDNVAGVSPFTSDCSIIENSIVFVFTDILPDDSQLVCEVISQEIAHSFGLDHEMLPSDPMTYLDYAGDRTFQDEMASCGEYSDRSCGINGTTCRRRQNSVALLEQRIGRRAAAGTGSGSGSAQDPAGSGIPGGCTVAGGSTPGAMALALLGVLRRRRRR
jgi:MYXO-CTERM domain-containing protein